MANRGHNPFGFSWTFKPEKEGSTIPGTAAALGGPEVAARVLSTQIENAILAAFEGQVGAGTVAVMGGASVNQICAEALKNRDKVEGSSASFWTFYMIDECKRSIEAGNLNEHIMGDAGVHGYKVDLKTETEKSEQLAIRLAQESVSYIDGNQNLLREIFEAAKGYGMTELKSFEDRLSSEKNIKSWLKILSQLRHPYTKQALKDLEIEFKDGKLQSRPINNKVEIRFYSKQDKSTHIGENPVVSVVLISEPELEDLKRNKGKKLQKDESSVIYIVNRSIKGTPVRCEQYFSHFHFDEEQSWNFFNPYIAKELKSIVDTNWVPKTEIYRSSKIRDSRGEWTKYTTADEFELSPLERDLTISTLGILSHPGESVSLSELFNLAWLLNNPESLSSNICVQSKTTAGLQIAHVPRIMILNNLFNTFRSNLSDFLIKTPKYASKEYLQIREKLMPIGIDVQNCRNGAGTSAVLFTYIPEKNKAMLANMFTQSNALITEGSMQTSFVSHEDAVIPNVTFFSADNVNAKADISRIKAENAEVKSVRYVYKAEWSKSQYEALRNSARSLNPEDEVRTGLIKKAKKQTINLKETLIDLCFMLSILELERTKLTNAHYLIQLQNMTKLYEEHLKRRSPQIVH